MVAAGRSNSRSGLMDGASHSIRMTGRERLTYREGLLSVHMDCFYSPANRAWTVHSGNCGEEGDKSRKLHTDEVRRIEERVRLHLAYRRFLGLRLRDYDVSVVKAKSL
jgi:hypothetical protein